MDLLSRFIADTRGATAIEYALIASLITVTLLATFSQIGTSLSSKLRNAASGLN